MPCDIVLRDLRSGVEMKHLKPKDAKPWPARPCYHPTQNLKPNKNTKKMNKSAPKGILAEISELGLEALGHESMCVPALSPSHLP
eukprot:2389563-Amphidinium_carterae.1